MTETMPQTMGRLAFDAFVRTRDSVDEPPFELAAPLAVWPHLEGGISSVRWAFAVRAVLSCDPLGQGAEATERLAALAAAEPFGLAVQMAADAHATVRDAAWEDRGETRGQWAKHHASQWGCSCEHLLTVLVDALVFAEWLDDVGYFSSSVSDETRRLWLRESVLWSRCLNPCTWAEINP